MATSPTDASDAEEHLPSANSTQSKPNKKDKLIVKNVPSETVTKAELQKFGTADPFLTKRTSNVFGVTVSPIGSYTVSTEQRSTTNASTHSKSLLETEEVLSFDDPDLEKSSGHKDSPTERTSASSETRSKENVKIIPSTSTGDESSLLRNNSIKKKNSEFSSTALLSRRHLSKADSKQSSSPDSSKLPLMNTDYLKIAVGKYLCEALCEVAIRRPERPIEFLAYHLISLYERDLEMKRLEKAEERQFEDSEKQIEDSLDPPMISQMFTVPISDSVEQQKEARTEDPLISSVVSQMFTRKLSISDSIETFKVKEESASAAVPESLVAQQEDSENQLQPTVHSVTENESKQFGTTDPFLARRGTDVFDVSGMSIGSFSVSSERRTSYASTSRSTLDTQESISNESVREEH